MNFFSGSTYIDGFTFFTVFIYIYSLLNQFLKFTYRSTICKLFLLNSFFNHYSCVFPFMLCV
ncbi:hypothetical protein Hanom_Chr01g00084671 [Helianthus anomalus]